MTFWKQLKISIIFPWIIVFILTNLFVTQDGGTNARSRFAALRAVTEAHTFQIDNYTDWTIDWSRTPDGHYYSNKAPGGMFLGLPLFFITDTIGKFFEKTPVDEKGRRPAPGYLLKTILSFTMQIIPFSLLIFLFTQIIPVENKNVSLFFSLAAFFGTTTTIMMNSYFGHGLAATCLLAMAYFLYRENFIGVGLFFGFAMLTDYIVAALILPLFLVYVLFSKNYARDFKNLVFGGIVPGLLWIWYHWVCFGSPFAVALQFQNPAFLTQGEIEKNMGGALSAIPSASILGELLWGTSRGILFTQPWILVTFFAFLRLAKKLNYKERSLALFTTFSLVTLLWIVSSYKDWHGGFIAGPRYLSPIFPLFAVLGFLLYDKLLKPEKFLLWIGLLIALALRAFIYSDTILAPPENLWLFYWHQLTGVRHTPLLRTSIFILLLLTAWIKIFYSSAACSQKETVI